MQNDKREWATPWLESFKNLYINGRWIEPQSGRKTKLENPATGKLLGEVSDAGTSDVDQAVIAATRGFQEWSRVSRKQRQTALRSIGELIRANHAELATLETLQNGKTYQESLADDLPESADVFDYYAGWVDKIYGETCPVERGFLNYTKREPVGVIGLVVPWNFPLLLACWKLAPALAFGNAVVLKPSPFTPLTLIRLTELIHEKGILPPGVLNLVTGGAECGEAMSKHSGIKKISFTGSTEVGKKIAAAAASSNLKGIALELGGKSPNILFEDTPDIENALTRQFNAMFSHKGEKCSEPTRLVVHEKWHSQAVEKLSALASSYRTGDPFAATTNQGPQCHKGHFEKVLRYIEIGKNEGAKLVAGGFADKEGPNEAGFFIRPTIFDQVTTNMRIAREEIFGPVLVIQKFKTEEEAIEIANSTDYGLGAGLYTSDLSRAHRVADRLESGMVFVNHYGCYDFSSPFGGTKQSGWGKEMAIHSLDSYTELKSIWIKYE